MFTYLMPRTSDEGHCIPLLSSIGRTFSTTLGPDASHKHYIIMTSLVVLPWLLPAVGLSQALMVTLWRALQAKLAAFLTVSCRDTGGEEETRRERGGGSREGERGTERERGGKGQPYLYVISCSEAQVPEGGEVVGHLGDQPGHQQVT